jgi:hypothetical protein
LTVYSIQCTVYSIQCTVYNIQCTVYSVQYTVYNIVYSIQCTVYRCTVYSAQYTVYSVQYTVYSIQYNCKMTPVIMTYIFTSIYFCFLSSHKACHASFSYFNFCIHLKQRNSCSICAIFTPHCCQYRTGGTQVSLS